MNAFQEAIKTLLIKARDEGMSRKEAAEALGVNYWTLNWRAKEFGIEWPHAKWAAIEPNERAKTILARSAAGETLEVIGRDFGITRERVRQIVKKYGGPSKRQMYRQELLKLAEFLSANPMTLREAVKKTGLDAGKIRAASDTTGVQFLEISAADDADLGPLAEKVRGGMSLYEASGHNHAVEVRLNRYCRKKGIKSLAPSRWTVSPKRPDLIAEMYSAGKSWQEIADALSDLEGTTRNQGSSIYNWAYRNMDILRRRQPAKPKPVHVPRYVRVTPVRVPKAPAEIELRETVRETAIVNRGKATASEIAAACGTTRNAVIGHWFRAR